MRAGIRAACPAIVALFIAALALVAPAVAGKPIAKYEGSLRSHPAATVKLVLTKEKVRGKVVEAFFRNIPMSCDNGQADTGGLRLAARVRSDGTFHRISAFNDEIAISTDEVRGRLLPGGRARGRVLLSSNLIENPSLTPQGDCTTGGYLRWQAKRVQR
jgi:hypothetical protein